MNGLSKSFTLQDIFMRIIKPHNQTGFAIVEVLIATVVLAIGFIELTRAFKNISSVAVRAVAMTRASNLTHATMERVMAQNFDARGNDLEFGDYALNFDGGNDHVVIADNPSLDFGSGTSFSISFWSNPSTWVQEGKYILDKTDGGVGYSISIVTGGGEDLRLQFSISAVDVNTATNALSGLENEWHQFEITCDRNGNAQWYIDSSTSGSAVSISGAGDIDNGSSLTIGSDNTPGNYFNGKIDEVRIWNDLRTADEIKASYNRSLSDPYEETNLKLYLRMNNGSGSISFDHSSSMAHGTITNSGASIWSSQSSSWSITLGTDGEASWSNYDDVDDFNSATAVPDDIYYDAVAEAGITKTITVVYVDINPTTWAVTSPSGSPPTDYKEIIVRVNIPGGDSYAQLKAIKSAKTIQNYSLTYSPYGN